jgi:hypothetical protein
MPYDAANFTDLEAATDCGGAASASRKNGGRSIGAKAMRSILALGLLITLCASANAATMHHPKPRHVIVNPGRGPPPGFAVPGWAYAAPRPPVHYDDTPSYNDPSKFGGQSLGIEP